MRKKYIIYCIIAIFLVVGVPFVINECYKVDAGYITIWSAEDVLSYYGAVLGGGITILTLIGTIYFTRKQIQSDRFLEHNKEKWKKVESIVTDVLSDISPLKMRNTATLDGSLFENIHKIISNLQSYAISTKTSLDTIKLHISPKEYEKIVPYLGEITYAVNQFCEIESRLEKVYMELQNIVLSNNGYISDENILKEFLDKANEIVKEIPIAYNVTYQQLLNKKSDVFESIYTEIETEANDLLLFNKRKKKK